MTIDNKIMNKAKKIKLIATDVDGVWTDSKMYYSKEGVFMKSFSTYDGMATSYLLKYNFIVVMITSEYENIEILKTRAKKLGINEIYYNEKDKLSRIKYLSSKYNISLNNIAYIGDGLIDIPILKKVGLSCSVPDAHSRVKEVASFITKKNGGHGAFREVVEYILVGKGIYEKIYEKMQKEIYKT